MKALHAPALAAIALLVALGDGAGAQEEAPAPASSAAPARSAASAAEALAAFEAKVQAVRKQLDATTDGEQRFRLLSDLAAAYYRAERVGDANQCSIERQKWRP